MVSTRAGPNDWLSAEQVDSDGHAAYKLNVNVVGGTGGAIAISSPLGTQAIAAAVAVTPATSSVWAASQSGTWNITNISGTVSLPTGAATEATLAAASAKLPATLGPKTPALSLSTVPAVLTPFAKAAGLTTSPFGATGAAGDYMSHVILQPAAVGAGTTTIFNNATAVYVYTAGTLADLRPITIPINAVSVGGSWNITTGANMAATGFGTFT